MIQSGAISSIALSWESHRRVGIRLNSQRDHAHTCVCTHAYPLTEGLHLGTIPASPSFCQNQRQQQERQKSAGASHPGCLGSPCLYHGINGSSHEETVGSILYDIMCVHMATSCVSLEFCLHHCYAVEYMATASLLWWVKDRVRSKPTLAQ